GGALKYRNSISQYHPGNGYTNPCLQASVDQISTISRPRSSTDAMNPSSSSSVHGRQLNGVLSRGVNGLHEDLDFPPTPRTLTRKKNVVWMRPHEMCSDPLFRLNPSSGTLSSRELPEPYCKGDPSLLAALGSLSQMPRLLQRIAPPEQNFDSNYCGMFK
ncbi:CLUMA_CG019066, isoform A, partial [Clunio marinus]